MALAQKKELGSRFVGSSTPSSAAAGGAAAAAALRPPAALPPAAPPPLAEPRLRSSGGLISLIEILKVAGSSKGLVTESGSMAGW